MKLTFDRGSCLEWSPATPEIEPVASLVGEARASGTPITMTFRLHRGDPARNNLMNLGKLNAMRQIRIVDSEAYSRAVADTTLTETTLRFSVLDAEFVSTYAWHCLKYDLDSLEIEQSAPTTA